jgi:ubiquinone/menaquinone biosynthesis C-methylase UbiE
MSDDNPRREYFDSIAEEWDGWMDLDRVNAELARGLDAFCIDQNETVLDIGCGTGNLTRALLGRLSDQGRVLAVDISPRMIKLARRKNADVRVSWLVADAARLSLPSATADRVICFSVWPHFPDPAGVARELHRVMVPGGRLHVWHIDSRETINRIHAGAGESVRGDILCPAAELTRLLQATGFSPETEVDDDNQYLVSSRKT